jgi:hypothetical protein
MEFCGVILQRVSDVQTGANQRAAIFQGVSLP